MRHFLTNNAYIFQRLESVEEKQLKTNNNVQKILKALKINKVKPQQGIFFNGQIFDACVFISDLIKTAEKSIILIDNFIDETVLQLFSKRKKGVKVTIYTKKVTKSLKLDLEKFNSQHPKISIQEFSDSHDRFLLIDHQNLYHFGASLKDLGKKWFAFSKMSSQVREVLSKLG